MTRHGVSATFWALADPVRIEILDRVAMGTATTVTELARDLPITRQAVSRHIRTLEEAGIVKGERAGREQHLIVDRKPLLDAATWAERRADAWDRKLERLARYVEDLHQPPSD